MNFDLLWKNYGAIEKKLLYYGQNYGTMAKTMVLYRELFNFDLRSGNGRLPKMVDYQKLRNFDLYKINEEKLW